MDVLNGALSINTMTQIYTFFHNNNSSQINRKKINNEIHLKKSVLFITLAQVQIATVNGSATFSVL